MITVTVKDPPELIPDSQTLAEAAAYGVWDLVWRHLVRKNGAAAGRAGMPRSNYWADAADSVTVGREGRGCAVTVAKEGAALHYYGGTVLPTGGRRALAIPVHPAAAGQRAAEYDPGRDRLALVWPEGSPTGRLLDPATGEAYYLLVGRARIPADPTVLPGDSELGEAARAAVEEAIL